MATPASKGLNALLATVSSADRAPVIVATRLRKGSANSARGAARLVADSLKTTRACGVGGTVILRADSAYYGRDVIAAARRGGAHFSITARKDRAVTAAISAIPADGWTKIRYPKAVFDEELDQWVSDAEVAETPFTAFASRGKAGQVTARLIVRRVRDANPAHVTADEQGELFPVWRHHAVFTDSPLPMLAAEADHRRHAIIEQVIADLKSGPLAHLPSGKFMANSGWLVLAAMAFNLTRAVGVAAGGQHGKAVTATIRAQLISIAGRITRSARRTTLRLPTNWPWANGFQKLVTASIGPPTHELTNHQRRTPARRTDGEHRTSRSTSHATDQKPGPQDQLSAAQDQLHRLGRSDPEQLSDPTHRRPLRLVLTTDLRNHPHRPLLQLQRVPLR